MVVATKSSKAAGDRAEIANPSDGAASVVKADMPVTIAFTLRGISDMLWHRWNPEYVESKGKAAKGSEAKKTDDLEMYVYRLPKAGENSEKPTGNLGIPGEYIRQSIIGAAKFRQDPRSPRKSAQDLFKAGVVPLTLLADTGLAKWDYEDKRRVVVQRNGINRTRPAMKAGWTADFEFLIMLPQYITPDIFHEVLNNAGKLIGLADFRPTYGRFSVTSFKVLDLK